MSIYLITFSWCTICRTIFGFKWVSKNKKKIEIRKFGLAEFSAIKKKEKTKKKQKRIKTNKHMIMLRFATKKSKEENTKNVFGKICHKTLAPKKEKFGCGNFFFFAKGWINRGGRIENVTRFSIHLLKPFFF